MNSKFKAFTDEINELKQSNFNLKESSKSLTVKLSARDDKIEELEE